MLKIVKSTKIYGNVELIFETEEVFMFVDGL